MPIRSATLPFFLAACLALFGPALIWLAGPVRAEEPIRLSSPKLPWRSSADQIEIAGRVSADGTLRLNDLAWPVIKGQDFWLVLPLPRTGQQFLVLELSDRQGTPLARQSLPILRLKTFPDIAGSWARSDIEELATLGLISDYQGTGSFFPDRPLTRAELIVILAGAAGLPPATEAPPLSDVLTTHWARADIAAAFQAGLIGPPPDGKFNPDGLVNRDEAVIWFCRLNQTAPTAAKTFWGLTEPYCHPGYLSAAREAGLWPDIWRQGDLQPLGPLTRAEAAAILARTRKVAALIRDLNDFPDELEISANLSAGPSSNGQSGRTLEVKVTQAQGWLDIGSVRLNLPASRRSLMPKQRIILPKGALFIFSLDLSEADLASAYVLASDLSGRSRILAINRLLAAAEPAAEPSPPRDLSLPDLFLDWPIPVYWLAPGWQRLEKTAVFR